MFNLETDVFILLGIVLFAACVFEFINGFHDTANAVATVIYTNSMKPISAVVWSGVVNFLGVISGGIGVGLSIIHLLPIDLLIDQNTGEIFAMVFAMLLSAIIWNFGTWYFGIPSSSSHTLIGAILGVALGYALLPNNTTVLESVNWSKAIKIFTGLLMAPVIGFTLAIILMAILKKVAPASQREMIFSEPDVRKKPPIWIRGILISTSTLVSFFHGRNDGQKGIGLIMLILVAVVPAKFALSPNTSLEDVMPQITQAESILNAIETSDNDQMGLIESSLSEIQYIKTSGNIEGEDLNIRASILKLSDHVSHLVQLENSSLTAGQKSELSKLLTQDEKGVRKLVDFAPFWVIMLISLSLGLGTMFSWKRIVVTIGEKIGKTHLNYAQGASAELVAATTIGLASGFGLPVSTTHTLSSGVAGTMVASDGLGNLQLNTIRNILITWVLTLPASIGLSAGLFLLFRMFVS
ncbi:inorganic phosphate transporter [Jiulongibacter sediminis]|uniref:Phosphate transporter n=1 Tax=Jiulongibacter sediminis TaxID=1605367 RepID=A0A0P7BQS7_9BACT|nr:inorganic phosphate transporter [Jiulongibacter sediminis]KPM47503.1 nuclease PIN [Jiulongibacter sediminis]TBX23297.1 nuclease PIN [Jiulongibacter sediminis]